PVRSAVRPSKSGTMAPPTIAVAMMPEPSAARAPSPSLASEKIVGNMIELQSPIASSDQPDTAPVEDAEIASNASTAAATHASTLPGEKMRSTKDPANRPTIAPPQ